MPPHEHPWCGAALALDPPDEASVHNNIGGVLSAQGQFEPALEAYSEAVEADPEFADGWYNLGNLLLGLSRGEEAERHLRRALRFAPAHAKVPRKLEQLYAQKAKVVMEQAEAEQKLRTLERATDVCGSEAACVQAQVKQADSLRDSDGPMIV